MATLPAVEADPFTPEKLEAARALIQPVISRAVDRVWRTKRDVELAKPSEIEMAKRHVWREVRNAPAIRLACVRFALGVSTFDGIMHPGDEMAEREAAIAATPLPPAPPGLDNFRRLMGTVNPFGAEMGLASRRLREAAQAAINASKGDESEARLSLWHDAAHDPALRDAAALLVVSTLI